MGNQSNIIVVGGSISGLMCGIALKHAGHNVWIIERDSDQRDSHMAGVGLGVDFRDFLALHDRLDTPFFLECTGVQLVKFSDGAVTHIPSRRALTSWDSLYYRLRALFDGHTSGRSPTSALPKASDGLGEFLSHQQLIDVRHVAGTQKVVASIKNQSKGETYEKTVDYVIGADGSNSVIRQKYLPDSRQRYTGYVGLRGTVPESELSPETREAFESNITILNMNKHHCLVYVIPESNGSLEPGYRLVNFLWYYNETTEGLDRVMVDSVTGKRHHSTVPAGHVREDVWNGYLEIAESTPFTPPYLELARKIRHPFIQVINEFYSPRAAFENGRVLLVGNAVSMFRPHTASSGTQAAFHAMETARLVEGDISVKRWEERVVRFSWLHWAQAEWWGTFYQNRLPVALYALLRYWSFCGLDRVKAWWYGEERLLRNINAGVDLKPKLE